MTSGAGGGGAGRLVYETKDAEAVRGESRYSPPVTAMTMGDARSWPRMRDCRSLCGCTNGDELVRPVRSHRDYRAALLVISRAEGLEIALAHAGQGVGVVQRPSARTVVGATCTAPSAPTATPVCRSALPTLSVEAASSVPLTIKINRGCQEAEEIMVCTAN